MSAISVSVDLSAEATREGELPPWEIAKALAYHQVLADISDHLETFAVELVGQRVDEYIAGKLTVIQRGFLGPHPIEVHSFGAHSHLRFTATRTLGPLEVHTHLSSLPT